MILDFWDEVLRDDPAAGWSSLVMWEMDLKGAYTLMDVRPEEAGMFAQELVDGLTLIWGVRVVVHTRGLSGHHSGHHMGAQTQAARQGKMYVDDIFGVSLRKNLEYNMACARKTVTDLLGSKSLAEDKKEQGTRLDIIGWVIDLDLCRLSIARKNLLKAFYGFFNLDLEAKTNLDEVERLASYSQ
jgi:hypothetical protein